MKKTKTLALLLCLAMVLSLAACGVKTKEQAQNPTPAETAPAQTTPAETTEPEKAPAATAPEAAPSGKTAKDVGTLKLLYNSSDEMIANVMRDLLAKAGFEIEMSAAADGATFREQEKGGNFDLAISSWANPVGTPDYGCRGIWESVGDSNLLGINDAHLDELVNQAATETPDVYVNTYGEAERYVVEEQCFMFPLYVGLSGRGYSKALADDSITANQRWEALRYVSDDPATRVLNITQTGSNFFTLDCIRADDQTSGYVLDEAYIHLVTLQPDWSVSVDQSLSYSYAINETNDGYYFLLRDDCFFARVDKDGNAYNSGVMVSGEDVVYSLDRAMDKDSTALHACYSMFASMEGTTIVTDMAELENAKTGSGASVREVLEANGNTIGELVASKTDVDNDAGKYQVVKVTTKVPYPQILNALSFHGAGIVDQEWVEAHNEGVDIANYDATKDRLYGDTKYIEESSFDNDLSVSGNYVPCIKNDYEMKLQANPGIRTREDNSQIIQNITLKFIADKDAALNALRSGDVDFPYSIPSTKYSIIESDPNLGITYMPGIRAYVLAFNMHGNSVVSESANLRKALASCIDFEAFKAVNAGNAMKSTSPLSTCLETGNDFYYAAGQTQTLLDAYFAEQ